MESVDWIRMTSYEQAAYFMNALISLFRHNMRGISWLSEQLLTSRGGFCCTDIVGCSCKNARSPYIYRAKIGPVCSVSQLQPVFQNREWSAEFLVVRNVVLRSVSPRVFNRPCVASCILNKISACISSYFCTLHFPPNSSVSSSYPSYIVWILCTTNYQTVCYSIFRPPQMYFL